MDPSQSPYRDGSGLSPHGDLGPEDRGVGNSRVPEVSRGTSGERTRDGKEPEGLWGSLRGPDTHRVRDPGILGGITPGLLCPSPSRVRTNLRRVVETSAALIPQTVDDSCHPYQIPL